MTVLLLAIGLTVACSEDAPDGSNEPIPLNPTDTGTSSGADVHPSEDASTSADTGAVVGEDVAGAADTAAADVGGPDVGPEDAGPEDTGPEDTGPEDAGPEDTGPEDTGPEDVGPEDVGPEDVGPEDTGPEDTGPEDTGPEDTGPPACDPPLKIAPSVVQLLPLDLRTFKASGGTGAYRFALTKDGSGAVLNNYTGAYLSGEKPATTDQIELTDLECVGSAIATAQVVNKMTLAPSEVTIAPAKTFTFVTAQGSGSVSYVLKTNASGGSVSAKGVYVAGAKDGLDVVVVTDTETGQSVSATISVQTGAKIFTRPARLVLPVGSRFKPNVVGGSGVVQVSGGGGVIKIDNGDVVGANVGVGNVVLTDVFTKEKVTVKTRVVASFAPEQPPVGDGLAFAVARGAGDLNNDGYNDAVLAVTEADFGYYNSGAVLVYHGSKKGLIPKPKQILAGDQRDARFGSAMEVVDVDGDGRRDLIVGAHLQDQGMSNNGAVSVHRGLKDGTFETVPTAILAGQFAGIQFGSSLAVCDFNGDGKQDIAVGAPYGENRGKSPVVNDQGEIYIFLGKEDGFVAKADQRRYGVTVDGKGKITELQNARIGWSLAAGDMDGDGNCDLAIGSLHFPWKAANDGAVLVFKGVAADKSSVGGLAKLPSIIISGEHATDADVQFGRAISAGDLDGDGKAELVVGMPYLDTKPGKTKLVSAGAYFAYDLDKLPAAATKPTPYSAAKWSVLGDGSYDYFGRNVYVDDLDGDGLAEIFASAPADEISGKPSGTGVLAVYKGKKGAFPATKPALALPGLKGGDWYGIAGAPIGDVDKDGSPDLLVYASHEDTVGYNHGRPYFVSSAKPFAPVPLEYETTPAGSRIGWSIAQVGDVTGDGIADIVTGAPYSEGAEKIAGNWVVSGTSTGSAWVLAGTKTGPSTTPKLAIHKFYAHGGGELFGWDVSGAGDFDGDGHQDFVVAARNDDRPANHGGSFEPVKCGGARNDAGAAYVFGGGPKLSRDPIAVIWGPQPNDYIEQVAGALKKGGGDINGDGRDDVVMASLYWDKAGASNAGGFGVAYGQPRVANKIAVICQPAYTYIGGKANDYVGRSATMIGDLDGDKCAEFAIGADAEDLGISNQGSVRVVFGWGAKCKSKTPREVVLLSKADNARAGYALDAGGDVDGDGLNDLVVGGFNAANNGVRVGAAWVVTAKYILSLKPTPLIAGQPPGATYPLADPKSKQAISVFGDEQNGYFGWSVAMIPGLEADGRAGIIVGKPRGKVGEQELAGGAQIYRFIAATGLMQLPWGSVVGETYRAGGELGWTVAGASINGLPVVASGGYYGTPKASTAVDIGSAYLSRID